MGTCCEKRHPLKLRIVFEKEVIFDEFDFENLNLEFEVSKLSIRKHRISCDNVFFFFFHYYLATSMTD